MPHFIRHILWFSGHSNCFPPNYEEKWLPFAGAEQYDHKGSRTLRIHTKIKTCVLTDTTCTRKSYTIFQFRDIPSNKYITPSPPSQNTHTTKQHVLFMLDQSLQKHTLMF